MKNMQFVPIIINSPLHNNTYKLSETIKHLIKVLHQAKPFLFLGTHVWEIKDYIFRHSQKY